MTMALFDWLHRVLKTSHMWLAIILLLPITIIFGRSVDALFFHLTYLVLQHYLAKEKTHETALSALMHCACTTIQLLQRSRLPFSCTMPPNNPELDALITRFGESYSSVSMSRESTRSKKSSSNWLNSGNALIQLSKQYNFHVSRFAW